MEAIATLIPSTCGLIDHLDTRAVSPDLTLTLDNIRKVFNEISKTFGIQRSYFGRQSDESFKNYASEVESRHEILQQLLQDIPADSQAQNLTQESRYSRKDCRDGDWNARAVKDVCSRLIEHVRESWTRKDRERLMRELRENKQNQNIYWPEVEEMLDLLNELRNNLKYYMAGHSEKEIDTDVKSKNKSENGGPSGSSVDHSSVKSLLTEKLKQFQSLNNEDDISCSGGKIVVKNSWIMNEMKLNSRGNATEPLNNLSDFSEASLGENPQSVGVYSAILPKASSKYRKMAQKVIAKEIDFQEPCPREKRARKQKTCTQCDIY